MQGDADDSNRKLFQKYQVMMV